MSRFFILLILSAWILSGLGAKRVKFEAEIFSRN
jgi:hypothetical protein